MFTSLKLVYYNDLIKAPYFIIVWNLLQAIYLIFLL